VTIFKELHIVTIVVGTIPKKRAIFLNLNEPFIFVVGTIDVRFAARGCAMP
jgi:hypothetical protein